MTPFVPISLATALLVLGCTVASTDNNNDADGGAPPPGPDSSTPTTRTGGPLEQASPRNPKCRATTVSTPPRPCRSEAA